MWQLTVVYYHDDSEAFRYYSIREQINLKNQEFDFYFFFFCLALIWFYADCIYFFVAFGKAFENYTKGLGRFLFFYWPLK